ncbi:non-ribosomal peptide synthetase [uncultured Jatrophihabitans sp.]|uniref:non-ribosomal peptide synthetase n=1 Tax=uncultured Jatrophihabitans sp. TaxID=1610747 RepID=UPI0035CAB391
MTAAALLRTIPERIAAAAAMCPDRVAVRDADGEITYAALARDAAGVAARLRARGTRPGELVGIVASRHRRTVVAMAGVLLAGAAYVPLEPTMPASRLASIAATAALRLCLVPDPAEGCPLPNVTQLAVDDSAGTVGAEPAPDLAGSDLAYVIFTSGSTGEPKGVQITHAAVLALLDHMARAPGLSPDEMMLGVTTPAFDLSVPDLLLPIITGATLVLAAREVCVDGRRLGELVDRAHPDLMQATPSTWRLLLAAGWRGRPGLRAVCGGEAYEASLVRAISTVTAGVWNFYGPTETTVWSVSQRLDGEVQDPVPMGFPIAGTWCDVIGDDGTPAGPGRTGELVIGGAGVSPGYLGRPDLTAAAFVEVPGLGRAFRTGDFVRRDAEGRLTFVERRDGQVKIRGYRIELGDVEAAARALPDVEQAVAVTVGRPANAIVAYVTVGRAVDADLLRSQLAAALPVYMVPARVEVCLELPLTANGKVDRQALAARAEQAPAAEPVVAPDLAGVTEHLVADLWAEVLAVPAPSRFDDFFALGGDSLAATRIVTRVADSVGVQLDVIDVFQAPTVADFALLLLAAMIADEPNDLLVRVEDEI